MVLKIVGVQEVDIPSFVCPLIETCVTYMLTNLAFGGRFEPRTKLVCKVVDCRSSTITLRQGLALLIYLQVRKT